MFSAMFSQGLVGQDVPVLISDLGIEELCNNWIEYIKVNEDSLRVLSAGEFDTLNLKINFLINRIITEKEE